MQLSGNSGELALIDVENRATDSRNVTQWTIKSIDEEVVEKARNAAKKRGMKISAWVGARLDEAASADLQGGKLGGDGDHLIAEIQNIVEKATSSQLERIAKIETDLNSVLKAQHSMLSVLIART